MLPLQLSASINRASEKLRKDSHYSLLPKDRLLLYRHVQEQNAAAYKTFQTWLAIITTKSVLPLWEISASNDDLFQQLLNVSEALAQNTITLEQAYEQQNYFYHLVGSDYYGDLSTDGYHALNTAYTCYCTALGGKPFEEISAEQIEQGFPDEIVSSSRADAASSAVLAYSGRAYDDSVLENVTFIGEKIPSLLNAYKMTYNPKFSLSKRLEFWEWWLMEAMPQAWELV